MEKEKEKNGQNRHSILLNYHLKKRSKNNNLFAGVCCLGPSDCSARIILDDKSGYIYKSGYKRFRTV